MKDKLLLSDKLISLMTLACVCGARNILVCWEDVSGRTHIRITPKRGRKRATDEPGFQLGCHVPQEKPG